MPLHFSGESKALYDFQRTPSKQRTVDTLVGSVQCSCTYTILDLRRVNHYSKTVRFDRDKTKIKSSMMIQTKRQAILWQIWTASGKGEDMRCLK